MDRVCPALLFFHARLCTDFYKISRYHPGSHCVRADRLCVQHRALSGKRLDKGAAGRRRYAPADGGTDRRSGCQYHAGSGADLRAWLCATNGYCGSGGCDRGRTDCCSPHCHAEGLSENACGFYMEKLYQTYLLSGFSEYTDAVCLYVLHFRTEYDLKGLFGSGSDNVGTVLQVADDLLYPTWCDADLYCACYQL